MKIEEIENPLFLKQINSSSELSELSQEIRQFLIKNISQTGGHFSSNLGIVELTVALHRIFDAPKDKIIFDVGHQCYVHKILTGRASQFSTLRQYGGMSGFQKRNESIYDCWEAGHSSTSISAATGFAIARDLDQDDYQVVAVIGDAAMMSGESFEALNYLGSTNSKVIIILNDNNMSISKNVGGLSNFLSDIRTSHSYNNAKENYSQFMMRSKTGEKLFKVTKKVKDKVKKQLLVETMFSDFGLDYIGPIDGHNMRDLLRALMTVKTLDHSVVLHVKTKKGKGYSLAEKDKEGIYHGVNPFDIKKGIQVKKNLHTASWSQIVANQIEYLMSQHQEICTITPAMISGSCLKSIFNHYPNRAFDVGIAEEHAMTFAAGLSCAGKFPFLSIYSSFLQRAYDQLNHDIARMNLPCLIGIDRSDLVGSDGETHHGVFDLGFLIPIPNLVIMSPSNQLEAEQMINTAFINRDHPYIMRYSKNSIKISNKHSNETIKVGSWTKIHYHKSNTVSVITYGDHVQRIKEIIDQNNLNVNIINARFIKPMDENILSEIKNTKLLIYETCMKTGSLGNQIVRYYNQEKIINDITLMGIEDHYVTHGDVDLLLKKEKLDEIYILEKIQELLNEERKS